MEINWNIFEKTIIALTSLKERQLSQENDAADYIQSMVAKLGIMYKPEEFTVNIPVIKSALLYADNTPLEAEGTSFTSGTIESKDNIISSLIDVDDFPPPNINFNPYSPSISKASYYISPALAINKKSLMNLLDAKRIYGEVEVIKTPHTSINILVGNHENPKVIIFAHYDSISIGAIDNASSVAFLLGLLSEDLKNLLNRILIVFAGAEELSYEWPIYWGKGYREFYKKHPKLKNKTVIVIDSIGHSQPLVTKNKDILFEAFPLQESLKSNKSIYLLYGDLTSLMTVYHSDLDRPHLIQKRYLKGTSITLQKLLDNLLK